MGEEDGEVGWVHQSGLTAVEVLVELVGVQFVGLGLALALGEEAVLLGVEGVGSAAVPFLDATLTFSEASHLGDVEACEA